MNLKAQEFFQEAVKKGLNGGEECLKTFISTNALIRLSQIRKTKLKQLKIEYLLKQGYTVYDAYNDITYKPETNEE